MGLWALNFQNKSNKKWILKLFVVTPWKNFHCNYKKYTESSCKRSRWCMSFMPLIRIIKAFCTLLSSWISLIVIRCGFRNNEQYSSSSKLWTKELLKITAGRQFAPPFPLPEPVPVPFSLELHDASAVYKVKSEMTEMTWRGPRRLALYSMSWVFHDSESETPL